MSKGYESFKGIMQKTLHPVKASPTPIVRIKTSAASSLNHEMDELEKFVVNRIGRLKESVKNGEAAVAEEDRRAEEITASLRATIATLEVNAKEAEDLVRRNDAASQSMEKSLTARIAGLEAQLSNAEKIVRDKESTIKAQEKEFAAKTQDLATQLRNNEKSLASRDAQIKNLTARLQALTNGIKDMSSFFRQAEALTAVEGQAGNPVAARTEAQAGEEKPATLQPVSATVIAHAPDAPSVTVPPNFFADMTRELSDFFGPIADIIVRDDVAVLGESMEQFPKARVGELLDLVSGEIPDEKFKISFRKRFSQNL
jgi:hypothetical protein